MDPTRVVLDCDTANEVDLQFAIAHALGAPDGTLEVRGVVSVHNTIAHGPGSRDMYQEEAERVVALCGAGDAGERARRVAGSMWGRSQLRKLSQQDGRTQRKGRRPGLSRALRGQRGPPARPDQTGAGKDTRGPRLVRRRLAPLERPIASYLADILELYSTEYDAPESRKELWDLACVAAVADPDSVTVESRSLPTLDAAGAHDFTQRGREVTSVSDLNERRILAALMEALKNHPPG